MNCPFCKGGPLVPLAPNSFTYKCPSCHRKTSDLELEQLRGRTLDSARFKLYGGARGGGKTAMIRAASNPAGIGQMVAAAWESFIEEPNVTVTPLFNPDFTMSAADYERQKSEGVTIGDIRRSKYPFWRAQHPNPEMWTDSPVESATEKDSLMHELEKKLTGRQT